MLECTLIRHHKCCQAHLDCGTADELALKMDRALPISRLHGGNDAMKNRQAKSALSADLGGGKYLNENFAD